MSKEPTWAERHMLVVEEGGELTDPGTYRPELADGYDRLPQMFADTEAELEAG